MPAARRAMFAAPLILVLLSGSWLALDQRRGLSDPSSYEQGALQGARDAGSERAASDAVANMKSALSLRPVSAYVWAGLADVLYRLGVSDETFRLALRRAAELGPHEPAVQEAVALYGLAVWDESTADTRAAVDRMVAFGLRRDPARMMQIAGRRGRLDVACAHVDPARRNTENWAQLCKGTSTEGR